MNVLIISDAYPPEIRSAAVLMSELARGLCERGHTVSVLTCYPQYNLTAEDRRRFADQRANFDLMEEGVRVIRAPAKDIHNCGPIRRGISFVKLPLIISRAAKVLKNIEAIIHYSPPLTLGLAAVWLKKRFNAAYIMNVQDLFPQNAIDLGILRNRAAIALFRHIESYCYRNADWITCHSQGNAAYLRRQMSNGQMVSVVHNWVELTDYQVSASPVPREELGLKNKFVLFFAGVMGFAQDLGTVIECARCLQDYPDIAFLLVGDGVEKDKLLAQAKGLDNVHFHPFIGAKDYPAWLASADVGLVTLQKSMKTPVVPSKILGYMAAGKAWIASVNPQSDATVIARQGHCGLLCKPGDPQDMARTVLKLYNDRDLLSQLGQNGRHYCLSHFGKSHCLDRYQTILSELKARRKIQHNPKFAISLFA